MLEPPFANEGLALPLNLLTRCRVDHVVVVGGDILMQTLGCMRQQIAMLVDGAALDRNTVPHRSDRVLEPRRTIDDEELGAPQAPPDEIVEYRTPGFCTLAAHALDCQKHLLAVAAHPKHDQH